MKMTTQRESSRWILKWAPLDHALRGFRVPRIPDSFLESVVYFYPSIQEAEHGENAGASGFLIGVPSAANPDMVWAYVITSSHVVREGKCHVLRLNLKGGCSGAVTIAEDTWFHHPAGDDVTIAPLLGEFDQYKIDCVPSELLLTQEDIVETNIGPGDEVFMVGRFIGHDGRQRNQPSVRSGIIAMMPVEPIVIPTRSIPQDSFLIEVRSLPGYSGSPVFVWIPPLAVRQDKRPGKEITPPNRSFMALLGVDWCHLRTKVPVREKGTGEPLEEGWYVESNSGMAGVIPAWKVAELLDSEDIAMARKKDDEAFMKRRNQSGVALDIQPSQQTRAGLEIPTPTRSEFLGDLRRTTRKKPRPSRSGKASR